MVNKLKWNLIASLLLVGSQAVSAQVPSVGDMDATGRVYAKVVVTISEDAGGFGHPAPDLRFLVVSESGDRISIRTNDAGVASTWVAAGSYRIVNPDPYESNGQAYTWDVIVPVRAGTGMIKLSQSNATKVVARTSPPQSVANAPAGKTASAASYSTIAPLVRNSVTEGFFIAPHLQGASLQVENDPVESGPGGGLSIGYGVSRNFALFLTVDAAKIDISDPGIEGNYTLAHVDLGVRLNLADESHKAVPYIQAAYTGRAAGATIENSEYIISGSGGTLGAGLNFYSQPRVGLDVGLSYTFGNFSKLTVDGDDYPIDKFNASGARFQIGLTFFPFGN